MMFTAGERRAHGRAGVAAAGSNLELTIAELFSP
jgi:hypothetical protein